MEYCVIVSLVYFDFSGRGTCCGHYVAFVFQGRILVGIVVWCMTCNYAVGILKRKIISILALLYI